jgi:hypothetical protein
METVFLAANLAVIPFWFLIVVAPHWRWTKRLMSTPWPVLLMPVLYVVLMLPKTFEVVPLLFQVPSARAMAQLLGTVDGVTIGWVHFLALDLFAGRWAYLDSRERGFSAWWVSPVLALMMAAGPLGLLLYVSARWWKLRAPGRR